MFGNPLSWFSDFWQTKPGDVTQNMADIAGAIARPAKTVSAYATGSPAEGYRWMSPQENEKWMQDSAMGFAGSITPKVPPMMGIRAYHGSPHDFDKFSMGKIGTGEGAQAYGHGLYFAENPSVAKGYRDTLAKGYQLKTGDTLTQDVQHALEYIHPKFKASGDMEAGVRDAIARMKDQAEFYRKNYGPGRNLYDLAVERLEKVNPSDLKPAGRMYEVNIRAKPEQFLDWDKPLSAQGAGRSLLSMGVETPKGVRPVGPNTTGSEAYSSMRWAADPAKGISDQVASGTLRDAGIPGIRYLDQGSRNIASLNDIPFNASGLSMYGGKPTTLTPLGIEHTAKTLYGKDVADQVMGALRQVEQGGQPQLTGKAAKFWARMDVPKSTSNYVLFRDDIIDIIRKYGIVPPMFGRRPEDK